MVTGATYVGVVGLIVVEILRWIFLRIVFRVVGTGVVTGARYWYSSVREVTV